MKVLRTSRWISEPEGENISTIEGIALPAGQLGAQASAGHAKDHTVEK